VGKVYPGLHTINFLGPLGILVEYLFYYLFFEIIYREKIKANDIY
jgi:hypothetical protein